MRRFIFNFFSRLQKKPYYIRIKIFYLAVAVFLFLVVAVWFIFSFQSTPFKLFYSNENSVKQTDLGSQKIKMPSLIDTLKASFKDLFVKQYIEESY